MQELIAAASLNCRDPAVGRKWLWSSVIQQYHCGLLFESCSHLHEKLLYLSFLANSLDFRPTSVDSATRSLARQNFLVKISLSFSFAVHCPCYLLRFVLMHSKLTIVW